MELLDPANDRTPPVGFGGFGKALVVVLEGDQDGRRTSGTLDENRTTIPLERAEHPSDGPPEL